MEILERERFFFVKCAPRLGQKRKNLPPPTIDVSTQRRPGSVPLLASLGATGVYASQLPAASRKLKAAFRHPPPPEGSERV